MNDTINTFIHTNPVITLPSPVSLPSSVPVADTENNKKTTVKQWLVEVKLTNDLKSAETILSTITPPIDWSLDVNAILNYILPRLNNPSTIVLNPRASFGGASAGGASFGGASAGRASFGGASSGGASSQIKQQTVQEINTYFGPSFIYYNDIYESFLYDDLYKKIFENQTGTPQTVTLEEVFFSTNDPSALKGDHVCLFHGSSLEAKEGIKGGIDVGKTTIMRYGKGFYTTNSWREAKIYAGAKNKNKQQRIIVCFRLPRDELKKFKCEKPCGQNEDCVESNDFNLASFLSDPVLYVVCRSDALIALLQKSIVRIVIY